ncbi:MAG: protein kinase [Pyrinomonadaceae bacterium]
MTPERWRKVNEVFQSAVELKTDERQDFLDRICLEDESLRDQVETLLAAHAEAGNFITGNAAADVGHLFTNGEEMTRPGGSLGHYEIVSVLGTGGMGKVYLAKDSKLNRSVALKTLPDLLAKEPNYVRRFQTEAKAAATINHPNVATVYSVEETDDDRFFITMEYVEGQPLNALIPTGGLDLRTFLEWFISLSDALFHAHQKGVIHRDIKPTNIMITPGGAPKILDFGLARIEKAKVDDDDSTLHLTKTGQVLGTPAYMSPEQAKGKQSDHRSDIFSLGVVMYEAITGEKPFKGDNYASIVSDLITKDPPVVEKVKPEIPYLLSRLIMKCLNKEPRYRYQSMNEVVVLLREIKSAMESGASLSKPSPALFSGRRKIPRAALFGAVALLLALASLGGWALWRSVRADQAGNRSIIRFSLDPPPGTGSNIFEAKITPDGKNIIFPSRQGDLKPLFIRPLDKYESRPIEGTDGGKNPFLSPDGKWIGFTTVTKGIKKVPLSGGVALTVCDICEMTLGSSWGEDNTIIFADNTGLQRVSANGGTPERLTSINREADEINHNSPQILPGGEKVLFTVETGKNSKVAVLSLGTKEVRYLEDMGEIWKARYLPTGHLLFARDTQLMAVVFDPENMKISGQPIPLIGDVFSFAHTFQIADNGTLIYLPVTKMTDNYLVWVNRDGESKPVFDQKGDFSSPRISPDGKRIVVKLDDDIWVYEVESGRAIRITTAGRNEIPLWSLDGRSVIYTTESEGVWTIYRKNADGTGDAEPLTSGPKQYHAYSIHPTENLLTATLFASTGNTDILTIDLTDKSQKQLLTSPFKEDTARFSPDGKWLAFHSMESGKSQVFVQPWGTAGERIPVTKGNGMFPVWTGNNRELIYRRGNKFFAVELQTSPALKVLSEKPLFEGKYLTSYDVSPDGERFLMVKNEHGIFPTQLNVILNWTEEFRQIVSSAK